MELEGLMATGDAHVPWAGLGEKGQTGWGRKAQGVFEVVCNPQLGNASKSGFLYLLCKVAQ